MATNIIQVISIATLLVAAQVFSAQALSAQVLSASRTPIDARLDDVCRMVSNDKLKYDTIFNAKFLAQVPVIQLAMSMSEIVKQTGSCTSVRIVQRMSDYAVKAELSTNNGFTMPVDISIDNTSPYRIAGLLIKPPVKTVSSWADLTRMLSELPGTTSIYAIDLGTGQVVSSRNAEKYLPVGSTHKLYTLGTLCEEISQGKRSWSDVVRLDSSLYSLPSGILQSWPHGSPVTLHTVASQMISISDNTATDLMLHTLGRERIESMQQAMYHSKPALNMPFLTTLDMFKLKFSNNASFGHAYISADIQGKRSILHDKLPAVSHSAIAFTESPIYADSIEWFASTIDLTKAMDWFRMKANSNIYDTALQILSINDGLGLDRNVWDYVGYKGGSESGVLNMTYLLKRKDGKWFALSASWTNPKASLDDKKFFSLVSGMINLLEK